MDDLGLPEDVVNVNGGAIALGHPGRLALTLLYGLGRMWWRAGRWPVQRRGGDAILLPASRPQSRARSSDWCIVDTGLRHVLPFPPGTLSATTGSRWSARRSLDVASHGCAASQLLLAVLASAVPLALAAPAARADDAGVLLGLVNHAACTSIGLLARAWSAHMSAADTLSHNPNVGPPDDQVDQTGENGVGEVRASPPSSALRQQRLPPREHGRPDLRPDRHHWSPVGARQRITQDFKALPAATTVRPGPRRPRRRRPLPAARPCSAGAPPRPRRRPQGDRARTVALSDHRGAPSTTTGPGDHHDQLDHVVPAAAVPVPGRLAAAIIVCRSGRIGHWLGSLLLSALAVVSLASAAFVLRKWSSRPDPARHPSRATKTRVSPA